jgi:biotin transport system substrate-specific component
LQEGAQARSDEEMSTALRRTVEVLGGVSLLTLSARVSIPLGTVPFTLQSWAVLLLGALLGPRAGALSVVLYLALAALGAPVLAQGAHGLAPFRGATAGYLFAFPLLAALAGRAAPALRGPWRAALPTALALHALLLALGATWLGLRVGAPRAWTRGVVPLLPGAALKSVLLVLTLRRLPRRAW